MHGKDMGCTLNCSTARVPLRLRRVAVHGRPPSSRRACQLSLHPCRLTTKGEAQSSALGEGRARVRMSIRGVMRAGVSLNSAYVSAQSAMTCIGMLQNRGVAAGTLRLSGVASPPSCTAQTR